MKKIISLFSVVTLFLWILPLGSFIKPSQEKMACGGNRAFHMCSMKMGKAPLQESSSKISFSNASDMGNMAKSGMGSSGTDFILTQEILSRETDNIKRPDFCPMLVDSYFHGSIDPPPKTYFFSSF